MKLPHVDSCCCGCDLKSASLLFGWINVIFNAFAFLCVLPSITFVSEEHFVDPYNFGDYFPFLFFGSGFLMAIFLLCGIYRKKVGYLNIWVNIKVYTSTIIFLIVMFYGSVLVTKPNTYQDQETGSTMVIFAVIFGLYEMGNILIVNSYNLQLTGIMKEENHVAYKEVV